MEEGVEREKKIKTRKAWHTAHVLALAINNTKQQSAGSWEKGGDLFDGCFPSFMGR